jgi:hypothetical protein
MSDPRTSVSALDAALAVLAEAGLAGCGATAAGPGGEVLLLSVPEALEEAITGPDGTQLRARLRDAGFRYVALDLAPRTDFS